MPYLERHGVLRRYTDLAFERLWRRERDPEQVWPLLVEAGARRDFAAFLAGEGGAEHDRLRGENGVGRRPGR